MWITSSSSTSVTCVASYLLTFDIITSRELISRLTRTVRRPVQYCHPPMAKPLPSRNSAVSTIGANVERSEIRYGGTVMLVPVLLRPFQVATVADYVQSPQPVVLDEPHRGALRSYEQGHPEQPTDRAKTRAPRPAASERCQLMLQCNALPNQCSAGTLICPGSFQWRWGRS